MVDMRLIVFKSCRLFDDGEDVITVEDLVILAVQFDFSAAVSADEHTVALLEFKGNLPAIVVGLTSAEGHDHAFHRFFFGGIGDDNLALLAFVLFLFDRLHRSEEHTSELQSPCNLVCRLLLEKKNNT